MLVTFGTSQQIDLTSLLTLHLWTCTVHRCAGCTNFQCNILLAVHHFLLDNLLMLFLSRGLLYKNRNSTKTNCNSKVFAKISWEIGITWCSLECLRLNTRVVRMGGPCVESMSMTQCVLCMFICRMPKTWTRRNCHGGAWTQCRRRVLRR